MIPKSEVMVDRKACEAAEVVCVVGGRRCSVGFHPYRV